eukprot:scaffold2015_cov125-Skeletonema_dohrnii-CCMP3373.AAC.8
MELFSASASNIDAVARTSASVASILDAERVERIAGQVQHKAWIDQNTIGIGKAHERIDIHGQRIDILERTIEALMNASATASNIDDVARTSASSLDAERVERIAGQVQHKALLTDALSELERPTKGSTSMRDPTLAPTPAPTPILYKKRAQAQPVSVRRSARKKPAKKYGPN